MISKAEPKEWVPVTHWAAIAGSWDFSDRGARYLGPAAAPVPGAHGLAICDAKFRDGLVRAKIRFEGGDARITSASAGLVLGYHSESGGYYVAGLGAFDSAYSIWEFVPGTGWFNRRSAGAIQNLSYDHDYEVEVWQKGQRISLVVDRVPVLEHLLPQPLSGNQLGLYATSKAAVQFDEFAIQRRSPMAFVAMQFGEPYDTIYRTLVRPKTQAMGFDVVRIDEINGPGIIFHDIQKKIEDAKVVIAEITAPNQNVFYEIGYAHALNKPTILLAQRGRELPFDIRSYRVIFYDDSIGGKPVAEKTLGKHLQSILQEI